MLDMAYLLTSRHGGPGRRGAALPDDHLQTIHHSPRPILNPSYPCLSLPRPILNPSYPCLSSPRPAPPPAPPPARSRAHDSLGGGKCHCQGERWNITSTFVTSSARQTGSRVLTDFKTFLHPFTSNIYTLHR